MTARCKMRFVKAWQRQWRPHYDPAPGINMRRWQVSRRQERRRRVFHRAGWFGDRVPDRPTRRCRNGQWSMDIGPHHLTPRLYRTRGRGGRR
jgi:hypothetical protein